MRPIKFDYGAPRWSAEILDCSMPMTFDTYSVCSYNCLYCFAFFQKEHSLRGYLDKSVRAVNYKKVQDMFLSALRDDYGHLPKDTLEFVPYIQGRYTMQWGGMSDGFDEYERQYGLSLHLLKFFTAIKYPLSISTKGTWFTKDKRYMDVIKANASRLHWKISIITDNEFKAKAIEKGVDSPAERYKAIERLAAAGCDVTLRLRPYIIGVSDDYHETITNACNAGADSVTTEFFCLETRATDRLKKKYETMSKITGYDLWDFYQEQSKGSGYRRLNYDLKKPYIRGMRDLTHKLGMRFYVSDAHHKEKSDNCACCGLSERWKVATGHFAEALLIAKGREDGLVYWSDIEKELGVITAQCRTIGDHPTGFNTGGNVNRSRRMHQTLWEYAKEIWNTPKTAKSPFEYFAGVLYPVGLDADNNVIYKYDRTKAAL